MRGTCSECHVYKHDYDVIKKGWHFNAIDPNVPPGRPGQPWIYVDAATGTQIPLSYRAWPGTFRPDQVGLSPFRFTQLFGRQMPGGGPGEVDTKDDAEIPRQIVSGKLEINCLSCHDKDPAHDQAEYASQIAKQSFRWAATASASFAAVSGSAKEMDDTFDYQMPDTVTDAEEKGPGPDGDVSGERLRSQGPGRLQRQRQDRVGSLLLLPFRYQRGSGAATRNGRRTRTCTWPPG